MRQAEGELIIPDMKLTFADFFAGCGGLSLGFIQAGLKCVSAMEIAEDAGWTYWYNLCYKGWSHLWIDGDEERASKIRKQMKDGETNNWLFPDGIPDEWLSERVKEPMPCANLFLMDIMKLEPEKWMEMVGVRVGDVGIFAGGPPCQGFSMAGNRDEGDARNFLALRFIHYVKVCQPRFVLIENVPGIISMGRKKGEKEGPFIHWIREAFNDAGYDMEYEVHNAADYGVPQNRRRVIFFAVRREEGFMMKLVLEKVKLGMTVLEAIGDMPPLQAGETWEGGIYTLEAKHGHRICKYCKKYNRPERERCHNCNEVVTDEVKTAVVINL